MNTPPTLGPEPKRNPWFKYFLWGTAFAVVAALAFGGTLMTIGAPIWEAHQAGALDQRWFERNMPDLLGSVWVTIGIVITILSTFAFVVLGAMSLWNLLVGFFSGAGKSVR
jgi:hypothetical protein